MSDKTPLDLSRYEGMTEGEWELELTGTMSARWFNVTGQKEYYDDGSPQLIAGVDHHEVRRNKRWICIDNHHEIVANARAIADVPRMIAEIKRLRAEVAELQKGRAK